MNWYQGIDEATKYIEDNLSIKVSLEEVAKRACCSSYNFQRLFSFITDISLSYYIKKRIVSKAADDLALNKMSVLEVAYKYGYDSVSSFSRAYKSINGECPSKHSKKGSLVTNFTPISFSISMKGANEMKFRLEKEDELVISGVSRKFSNINGENFIKIPQMWDESMRDGSLDKISKGSKAIFGACYDFASDCSSFSYMIGSTTKKTGYEELHITPQLYAKFECVGVKDLQETTKKIFADWLPNSKYKHANSPELEYYPTKETRDESKKWPCEIWIPVEEK
jgi:AraC family transcriptional regulator